MINNFTFLFHTFPIVFSSTPNLVSDTANFAHFLAGWQKISKCALFEVSSRQWGSQTELSSSREKVGQAGNRLHLYRIYRQAGAELE